MRIKDIAKMAGVSPATVSNVINDSKYVSGELKQRVMKVIKENDFKVNKAAKSLKCRRSNTIGVVLQNISNAFFPEVLYGIEDVVQREGFELLFCNTYYEEDREKYHIDALRNQWVDGIILDSCINLSEDSGYLAYLQGKEEERQIPVVVLEQNINVKNIRSIAIDNYKAAYEAAKHLLEVGRRKIVHITGPLKYQHCVERLEGYRKAIADSGTPHDRIHVYEGDFRAQTGYEIARDIIVRGVDFDGIFAANDQMAVGAIKAIREFGMSVPEDIAVVGFDNIYVSSMIEPSLTTVNVPRRRMGSAAALLLAEKIKNRNADTEVTVLPANLVIRQSTSLKGDKSWNLLGW